MQSQSTQSSKTHRQGKLSIVKSEVEPQLLTKKEEIVTPAKIKIDTSSDLAPKKVKRRATSSGIKKASSKSAAASAPLSLKDELKRELKEEREPEIVKQEVVVKDEVIVKSERIDLDSDRSTKAEPQAQEAAVVEVAKKRTLKQQKLNKIIKTDKGVKEES